MSKKKLIVLFKLDWVHQDLKKNFLKINGVLLIEHLLKE